MGFVIVRKLDHASRQVTVYIGQVLWREDDEIVLHATWQRPSLDLGYTVLEPGDRFIEHFYADRWYNIFKVRAADGRLKGWYCNVTRPARISEDEIAAEDLALDLWVAPDGTMQVLDEDEFAALPLISDEREAARMALAELQALASRRAPPFDESDEGERTPSTRLGGWGAGCYIAHGDGTAPDRS